ncbi:hypothetical protein AA0112_g11956 [Alternaria arborescens]|nr:hypothetical protein AA0112_g11956 [Alternaria arborescens]
MYNHPDNKFTVGEEAPASTASSLPQNSPDNEPISDSWSSDEDDLNTSPILKHDLSSSPNDNDDSLASSSPPFLSSSSPSSSQKKEHVPSGLPPKNPFSSIYNAPPPRSAKDIKSLPSPAATPTPPPRSGRSSELTSARIAAYEARTAEAAARATAGTIVANLESQSPPLDGAVGISSASQPPDDFHKDATQQSPGSLSDPANKLDESKKPRTARHASLSARPTTKPNQPTLEGENDKGSSPVSSQVSLFADFYVPATDEFPELSDDGVLEPDCPQQNRISSGPSARRSGIILSELEKEVIRGRDNDLAIVDDDEEEEWWEMEDEDERKPRLRSLSHFQIGGENDMTAFPVGALNRREGHSTILDSRFSFVSDAPSVLDLSDAQWEEDSRLYWEGACAELNEVADSVLAANEDDPRFARINPHFSRSAIPPKGERSEPAEFSDQKPSREDVLQVFLSGYLKYEVSNVFHESIDRTKDLNEEADRRARCIDDPDAEPSLPTCPVYENLKLPLHERLSNMLPSPSNFTPPLRPDPFAVWTYEYRPKDHSLQVIKTASTTPGLELRDESLKARAEQYRKNRELLRGVLKDVCILKAVPDTVHALECPHCHSVGASGSIPDGPRYQADVDALQSLILEQHELRRDLERLEATKRGVQGSISTLSIFPSRHRFGNAKRRLALAGQREREVSEGRREALEYRESRERISAAELCPLDQELDQALNALDSIAEPLLDSSRTSIATANLATRECFPFVNQAGPRRAATRRSSSQYSDCPAKSKDEVASPQSVPEKPDMVAVGNVPKHPHPPGAQDRAAAYQIMKSVQTYHSSGRKSQGSVRSGSVDGDSARVGRTKERRIQEDVVVTSPSRYEVRYPKRQNIVK